jgi:Outer membrane protein beta-barrel family/CarboxypepD_reg-like domain
MKSTSKFSKAFATLYLICARWKSYTFAGHSKIERLYISLLLILCYIHLNAQGKIEGLIIDQKNQALPGVNVSLIRSQDSVLITGTSSGLDGKFSLKPVPFGTYHLVFSMIGFTTSKSEDIELTNLRSSFYLPHQTLQEEVHQLNEVVVKAVQRNLEYKGDRLIFNVASSGAGEGSSTIELLQMIPGVLVINESVRLNGREGVNIYVDGRQSGYSDFNTFLKDMPGSMIERIEVISNPGARYDAAGSNGIINVVLKKNANLGTNGNYSLAAGYGRFEKSNASLALNHRKGIINIFGNIGGNLRHSFDGNTLSRWVGSTQFSQDGDRNFNTLAGNLRLGMDLFLNKKNTIGILASGNQGNTASDQQTRTDVLPENINYQQQLNTINIGERNWRTSALNLNYRHKIDTTGHEWTFDLDRSDYIVGVLVNQHSDLLKGARQGIPLPFRNTQPTLTGIWSAKTDYSHPFNAKTTLDLGMKWSQAHIDSDLKFEQSLDDKWENDQRRSNHFIYDEQISAAYANLLHKFGKFSVQAGLRFEATSLQGKNQALENSNFKRNYQQLFPSLFISRPVLVDKMVAHLSYSRRIDRPVYQDLNPFVMYMDPFTFRRGNTELRPQLTDTYKFRLTYDGQPFMTYSYNVSRDPISRVTEQNDAEQTTYTYSANLGTLRNFDASIYFPIVVGKKLSGIGGVSFLYNEYNATFLNEVYVAKAWSTNYYLQLSVKLPKNLSIEGTGWYQSKGIDGLMSHQALYGSTLSIQKKFPDSRSRLRLAWTDPLFKYWQGATDFKNMNLNVTARWETSILRLSWSQSFGNKVLKDARKRTNSTEDEQKRVKTEDDK